MPQGPAQLKERRILPEVELCTKLALESCEGGINTCRLPSSRGPSHFGILPPEFLPDPSGFQQVGKDREKMAPESLYFEHEAKPSHSRLLLVTHQTHIHTHAHKRFSFGGQPLVGKECHKREKRSGSTPLPACSLARKFLHPQKPGGQTSSGFPRWSHLCPRFFHVSLSRPLSEAFVTSLRSTGNQKQSKRYPFQTLLPLDPPTR